jgi:hypothetical protein
LWIKKWWVCIDLCTYSPERRGSGEHALDLVLLDDTEERARIRGTHWFALLGKNPTHRLHSHVKMAC